jgi:restriction endonuclease Mrr
MGYRTTVTDPGPDGGIDVVAKNSDEHIAIQAKRYSEAKVGGPTAQQVGGLAARDDFDRSILVTTSSFTAPAKSFSERVDAIELIDGTMLCELLELNEVDRTQYH